MYHRVQASSETLDVWFRHVMDWIDVEPVWLLCSELADVFEGREALQGLEALGEVVGVEEGFQVGAQAVVAAAEVGFKYDSSVLNVFPCPTGMQHDESKSSWFFWFVANIIAPTSRSLKTDANLHPSVLQRFELSEVLHYDTLAPYRPASLRQHIECMHFYDADELIRQYGLRALAEAQRLAGEPEDKNKKPEGYWTRLVEELRRRLPVDSSAKSSQTIS